MSIDNIHVANQLGSAATMTAGLNALSSVLNAAGQIVPAVAGGAKQAPAQSSAPANQQKPAPVAAAGQQIMQALLSQMAGLPANPPQAPGQNEILCGPPTSPLLNT